MGDKRTLLRPIWSVIGLNIGWFACVLGAAWEIHWLSIVIVLFLVIIHLFVIGKKSLLPAILLGLASLAIGFVLDSILIAIRTYEPNRWFMPAPITTIWLLMLWLNFSLALNESLKWFQKHLFVAAIMGSIFGPLAYLAASRLGAVKIMTPVSRSLLMVSVVWFIAMSLMSVIAKSLYQNSLRFRNK
jgi:hypothetical protein